MSASGRRAGRLRTLRQAAGGPPRRQAELLRRAPDFRLLFLATAASGLGTWLAVIALQVDVYGRTHSAAWVSALLIAEFLPSIAMGLLLGPLVDRLSRRGLMVVADVVRAAVFVALPFASSATAIVVLAGVAGFTTAFFRPAVYAGLANLVDPPDLAEANSLFQSVDRVTYAVGPLLGGVLVAAFGTDPVYLVNAASFVVSAALIVRIAPRLLQVAKSISRGHWRDLADGFRLVRTPRALMTVIVAWSIVVLANACINVAEIVLAQDVFDAGDFGFGLLYAGFGIGLVAGSLYGGAAIERLGVARAYGGAIGVMAAGVGAAAVAPGVWVAFVFVIVFGVGNGIAVVSNSLLVQRGAPDELRGRAFTVVMSINFIALGIGMAIAGRLTDAVGARWVWGIAALLAAGAPFVGYAMARGVPEEPARSGLGEPERAGAPAH